MRVVMFSYGTRGDVQPQLALAEAITAAGHEVRVGAPTNLRKLVEGAGFEFAALYGDSQAIMESERGRRWLASGDVRAFFNEMSKITAEINAHIYKDMLAAARDADLIVGGTLAEDSSASLAEHLGVPFVNLQTFPVEPTRAFPNPLVTQAALPFGALNLLTHKLFVRMMRGMVAPTLDPFRKELGLGPITGTVFGSSRERGYKVIQALSEEVVPRSDDLHETVRRVGFIRLPAAVRERLGERSSPGLDAWIAEGEAPIYVGYGSMPIEHPRRHVDMALAAAEAVGRRVIVAAGWTRAEGLRREPDARACFVDHVDHSTVFPKCAAVVHHGGAGTTAASLEAGAPTVVCSVFADQPFWGSRVARLGVGAHVPFAKLDLERLKGALKVALTDDARAKAAALGARLRAEDGLAQAAATILGELPACRAADARA